MIRRATSDDIEGIALVSSAAWAWAFVDVVPPDVLANRCEVGPRIERLRDSWVERAPIHVYAEDGKVLGFASESKKPQLDEFDAEIEGLYVHPQAAWKGVGRMLVKTCVRGFLGQRCHTMGIHTLTANAIGRAFYEKIGGRLYAADEWNGLASVWYAWDEQALKRLLDAPNPEFYKDSTEAGSFRLDP